MDTPSQGEQPHKSRKCLERKQEKRNGGLCCHLLDERINQSELPGLTFFVLVPDFLQKLTENQGPQGAFDNPENLKYPENLVESEDIENLSLSFSFLFFNTCCGRTGGSEKLLLGSGARLNVQSCEFSFSFLK